MFVYSDVHVQMYCAWKNTQFSGRALFGFLESQWSTRQKLSVEILIIQVKLSVGDSLYMFLSFRSYYLAILLQSSPIPQSKNKYEHKSKKRKNCGWKKKVECAKRRKWTWKGRKEHTSSGGAGWLFTIMMEFHGAFLWIINFYWNFPFEDIFGFFAFARK